MTLPIKLHRAALADLAAINLRPATLRALVDRAHEWLDAKPGREKANAKRRFVRAVERQVDGCPIRYLQVHVAAVELAEAERKAREASR